MLLLGAGSSALQSASPQVHLACCLQVYIPDDDIVQHSRAISRAFDIQEMYKLDLAQPAMCSTVESDSVHGIGMYMEASSVLRYGTFVEIMVPLFSMNFFKGDVTPHPVHRIVRCAMPGWDFGACNISSLPAWLHHVQLNSALLLSLHPACFHARRRQLQPHRELHIMAD